MSNASTTQQSSAGSATYAALMTWPLADVEAFLEQHPEHIAAGNAVRQLRDDAKREATLKRMGRRGTRNGMTKNRFSHGFGRVPTKRELR